MLLNICWDDGKDLSALLLLIHPAQAPTSPLFGEADVQFLKEKWPFPRYAFHYKTPRKPSIRCWCCLVFDGIMEKMYQHCCCSSILHKQPLHPFLARPTYNFWKRNGRFRGTLFIIGNHQGSQSIRFWYCLVVVIYLRRCHDSVVVCSTWTCHYLNPSLQGGLFYLFTWWEVVQKLY